jgi:hypothetical protein
MDGYRQRFDWIQKPIFYVLVSTNCGRYWDRTSDPHNVNRVSLVESYDSWSFDLWRCDSHGNL